MLETDEEFVSMWKVAHERTRQLNKIHHLQIDLVKYELDLYELENIHFHFEAVKNCIFKKKPNLKRAYKTTTHDLDTDDKYLFPIREVNYEKGKNSICSIVDDSVFFSYKDREKALSLIFEEDANNLRYFGYLKWSESQLIDFLSKRMLKKLKTKKK